jgi:hypothetical protein
MHSISIILPFSLQSCQRFQPLLYNPSVNYKVPKLEAWKFGRTYANIIGARESNVWNGRMSKPFCILQLPFYRAWRFVVELYFFLRVRPVL